LSRNQKIAYIAGAVIVLVLVWEATPAERLPADVWATGFKVRLIGFVTVILVSFYFFFDRVVGNRKKGK
jgi:hypothetical protein